MHPKNGHVSKHCSDKIVAMCGKQAELFWMGFLKGILCLKIV